MARIRTERELRDLICPECTRRAEDLLIVGTMTSSPDYLPLTGNAVRRDRYRMMERTHGLQLDIFALFTQRTRELFPRAIKQPRRKGWTQG